MRIGIIATKHLANQFLCVKIQECNEVVAVFHPQRRNSTVRAKIANLQTQLKNYGFMHTLSHRAANSSHIPIGWSPADHLKSAESKYFMDYDKLYEHRIAPLACDAEDINSPDVIKKIKDLNIDAMVCSGGPIYRRPLIESVGTMLNFHTGISPIYNGSNTIWWAYANGHIHLCGGTLMIMNSLVDGGDMLGHYLPSTDPDDDPADLFCKTIIGGARLYNDFLTYLKSRAGYHAVRQFQPFFYYRGYDWTVYQSHQVDRRRRARRSQRDQHPEQIVRYWDASSRKQAEDHFRSHLVSWLGQQRLADERPPQQQQRKAEAGAP